MNNKIFLTTTKTGLMVGMTLLAVLTGCMVDRAGGYRGHAHVTATFEDDYDYYPGYETYYSRNRREFVYLEGRTWVRRPEPRGVSVSVFLAAPSVRLDFRDAPEQHHTTVIRSYPKTWTRPNVEHGPRQAPPPVIVPEARHIKPANPAKPEPPAKHKSKSKDNRPNNKDHDKKGDDNDHGKKDDRHDDDRNGPDRTDGRR